MRRNLKSPQCQWNSCILWIIDQKCFSFAQMTKNLSFPPSHRVFASRSGNLCPAQWQKEVGDNHLEHNITVESWKRLNVATATSNYLCFRHLKGEPQGNQKQKFSHNSWPQILWVIYSRSTEKSKCLHFPVLFTASSQFFMDILSRLQPSHTAVTPVLQCRAGSGLLLC